jgi:hypothetical protein
MAERWRLLAAQLSQSAEQVTFRIIVVSTAANIEGNQFTPEQLGDLVAATLRS